LSEFIPIQALPSLNVSWEEMIRETADWCALLSPAIYSSQKNVMVFLLPDSPIANGRRFTRSPEDSETASKTDSFTCRCRRYVNQTMLAMRRSSELASTIQYRHDNG
jgi:hypothetical protein